MRKLTTKEKQECFNTYKDVQNKVKVHDFQSAIEACKQKVCQSVRKERKLEKRKQRKYGNGKLSDYKYQGKILRGEINPPSSENTKRFISIMRNKYGSVENYHIQRKVYKVLRNG